jgi:hypothetical protein
MQPNILTKAPDAVSWLRPLDLTESSARQSGQRIGVSVPGMSHTRAADLEKDKAANEVLNQGFQPEKSMARWEFPCGPGNHPTQSQRARLFFVRKARL